MITAATAVDDLPINFGGYQPSNWYNPKSRGYVNVREFLACSANVPEVILLQQLGVSKSLSYLEKMGVDVSAEGDVGLSLALGGMTNGLTPLEMAAAYATIANGGVYRTPNFYTKITNKAGETVVEAEKIETRVFSEQNAWILQDLLKEPIYGSGATGGSARISGQEVRGKTGTTNGNSSSSFCGFTKYYTASVWLGFDHEADGNDRTNANSTICARLYQSIMSAVHSGKPSKGWDKPGGITTAAVCKSSGKLSTEECKNDPEGGKVYTEYFAAGHVPTEYCDVHKVVKVCEATGKLASENCKNPVDKVFITRPNAETDTRWKVATDAKFMAPTETCEECKPEPTPTPTTEPDENGNNTNTNSTNTNTTNKNNTNNTNTNTNSNSNANRNNTNNSNTNTNTH